VGAVVAITGLVLLGWLAWHLTHSAPAAGPAGPAAGRRGALASTVGIATAKRADLPVRLDALGTVIPAATVTVRPQVSGVITQVLFKEGQTVKKGALLATIDPRPFELALAQAGGARQRDEAQLAAAKVTLGRVRTLLGQDTSARQDVDTQAALVKQLEATVAIDRANEGTARLNLSHARIVAPIGGRIGFRQIDAGNYIGAGDAAGVAVITQLAPIDVEFAVPQDRVPEIRARVAAGAALPVVAFDRQRSAELGRGTFSTLDNLIDTQTGTVKAQARFANADATLFPNQFVNVQLLLRTIVDAVVVPVTALRHGPDGDFVYVLRPDHSVALRPVVRGQAGVDTVAIAAGLEAGEQVVTEGGDRLKDGARVQIAGEPPGGAASGAASGSRNRRAGRAAREHGASAPLGARPASAAR
jgi:multidrug efflux system membrane fusion protein